MVLHRVQVASRIIIAAVVILPASALVSMAQGAAPRVPVPDAAAQQKALDLIREVYGKDLDKAKNSVQKLAVAKRLLEQATRSKGQPASHFVLLREARDLSVRAGMAETALQAIDRMAAVFQIDGLEMKVATIGKLAKSARLTVQSSVLSTSAAGLIDEAISGDNYETADRLAAVALAAARKARDGAMVKEMGVRKREVEKAAQTYAKVQGALVTLNENPVDPDANLAAGEYFCFVKNDWEKGVPMLALGSNQALKTVAVKELTESTSPGQQAALGDGWRDLAQSRTDLPGKDLQERAAWWYLKALPELSDLARVNVEKSLRALVASGSGGISPVFACRSQASRALLVAIHGGSAESERAVEAGLKWLAAHQMPDGGWTFNHALAPGCQSQCTQPGSYAQARNAATAMALLPLLAAGNTHKQGRYKTAVKNGLYFLVNHMKRDAQGGSFWELSGRMYSHGLASIALCEAYAMTRDKALHQPAQEAINFICNAQDPIGGGWRYTPRQGGDTSVFAWQLAALKAGQMGELQIPPVTTKKAFLFLDSVQTNGGANYGYIKPISKPSTTAIGLLGRMYLGWGRDNPALQRGIQGLSTTGPSASLMYQNYYATQLMRQQGGGAWKKWNPAMRGQLVNSQAQGGHQTGSWYVPPGDYGATRGGRLYCTSMALLTLEVYYRYPLIGQN